MLEVIIELTAAESNIPYVVNVLPFSGSHSKWNNFEQYKTPPVTLCHCIGVDTTGELCSGLPLTSSISFFVEICNSEW